MSLASPAPMARKSDIEPFLVIGIALVSVIVLRRRRERHGSDAGKAA